MSENASLSLRSSVEVRSSAPPRFTRLGGASPRLSQLLAVNVARCPNAATTTLQCTVASAFVDRTTANRLAQRSNSAVLTDTYSSPLRAQRGAANRER